MNRLSRHQSQRFSVLSFNKLLPNMITVMALCFGMSCLRFAFAERWKFAVGMILLAAVFDALDGRMARLLRAQSRFGAELDSLSDFLCFGVVPAVLIFLWSMIKLQNLGWMVVLFFAICCVLRLARFNVRPEDNEASILAHNYVIGVPAPAGAGLALLPLILDFQFYLGLKDTPIFVAIWLIGVGLLMVSHIPTYSFKQIKLSQGWIVPTLLFSGLITATLISVPWFTLSILLILYLSSIPLSLNTYRKLLIAAEKIAEKMQQDSDNVKAVVDFKANHSNIVD
ncbi:CDP-diacylglycerol--serine O-phosphatidyltransferase [Candidatus Endolissoclinum faulkneri L2]|uniref:CDP-diacylglycerol--serine O-phosphatidyltransferase n=1 Tax=Candidatus Endolissoclinum faulkneri L2 TaxID=1193729 RepID=K7YNH1_9PROT|nr:phosphatidylcholine/phosphatidylserine synthase [Candidatus Endolissoclinum faulkneri]AFX99067.1 CDP-diacylglycerol--serine O-phosphatidyltransferase [Candidatus Endolissoclinum faulkneri L2]